MNMNPTMNTNTEKKEPKILIGCPTHKSKMDSLEKYFNGLYDLTYQNFDLVIEDNSPTKEYFQLLEQIAKDWEKTIQPKNAPSFTQGKQPKIQEKE